MAVVGVKCRFCDQTEPVKKYGTGNEDHPRCRCQSCCKTFQFDYRYRACQLGIKSSLLSWP
jgi:transposase